MINFFSVKARKEVKKLLISKPLLAFDFDGTLAPLVERPERAQMSQRTRKLLMALSKHYTIAVISGRARQDLTERLGVKLDYVVGNHGLEGLPGRAESLQRAIRTCRIWSRQLALNWAELEAEKMVFIEDKKMSLSIHYRGARHVVRVRNLIEHKIKNLKPSPRIIPGKYIFNLMPPGSVHKGTALLKVMQMARCKDAWFLGDDITDDYVFNLGHPGITGILIGRRLGVDAQYFISSQRSIDRALCLILNISVSEAENSLGGLGQSRRKR